MILVVVLGLLQDSVAVQPLRKPFGRLVPAGRMDNNMAVTNILETADAAGNTFPFGWGKQAVTNVL